MPHITDSTTSARDRAADLLQPGASAFGFNVVTSASIEELDATAYVLRHAASGARLLYLACEDEQKAFSIGFKTPPADDTGVFHILEHSVLCGSEKFPLKEPFVDLIKSSMQTFLNAMTYPDKTVYPVASTNEQDLINLMDVYMDAVLHPAIYTKPTIFQQEGWHYELDVPEGASVRDGQLRCNGVVYNEMKGALSDPMDVLDNAVNRSLYPDTAYAHESGGNPRAIPNLTYEQFLDTHARHYNLRNSYIVLYGDMHIERELEFLDREYLAPGAARDAARQVDAPNELGFQQPVAVEHRCVHMKTTPENAMVGMAYVLGRSLDRKRIVAADILFESLLASNEAPIKAAIMAAGLGGNVVSYTAADHQQPYELIMLQNAKPEVAHEFRRIIEDTCRDLVENGIPRDRLEAVISGNEYDLRQRDFGMADGVAIACDCLATWLYDDDAALSALQYAPIYAELRRDLDGSYFEDLLRELVLDNKHYALVELVPVEGDVPGTVSEEERLARAKAAMSDAALEQVVHDEAELRAAQEAEDTDEARATLPRLHVSDIGEANPEPPLTCDTTAPIPCLKHDIPTHRLAYATYYFDLSHLGYAELPYATVLSNLLQQLPTSSHSASELDSYIGSNLGSLSFRCEVYSQPNWRLARPKLTVTAGALSEKLEHLASIPQEIWSSTLFEDTGRMRDILTQMRIGMEQSYINNGHMAALGRAMSYVSPASVVAQQLSGIEFYRFLRELLDHFDERKDELCATLRELSQRIFTSTDTLVSFTGSDEDYRRFWVAAGTLGLSKRIAPAKELYVPAPEPAREAFIIPSDVCYVARAVDPRALDIVTDGRWSVAAQVLSYDYLWNEVRVKGGAYGCGFRALHDRQLGFYTYRDPAIDPSLERFDRAGAWLSGFDPSPEAFEGFIVSCASGCDAPLKPLALAKRQDGDFLTKREAGWREKIRRNMLETTVDDLRSLADTVSRVAREAPLCIFGGKDIIEASSADIVPVDFMA